MAKVRTKKAKRASVSQNQTGQLLKRSYQRAPSMKQQALAAELVTALEKGQRLTKKQLMIAAGYSVKTAKSTPSRHLLSRGFQDALAKHGISEDTVLKIYREAGDAKQGSWHKGTYHEADKPDHNIRLKAADGLADVLGLKKRVIETKNVNINLDAEDVKGFLGLG